jgi:predicted CoA-substrate-specific enzyme activase
MITAGIDAGAATTKAVILMDGSIAAYVVRPTGFDFQKAAETVFKDALKNPGIPKKSVECIYATGYGKNNVKFADGTLSEITAHAKGIGFIFPEAQGIIDIGGQDSKAILVKDGKVIDFLMNDKCAAGTGKFLEHTARALEVPVEDMGALALRSKKPANISSMCTVFAESEVISLRAKSFSKEDIAAGLVAGIARRVVVMARRAGLKQNIVLVGGVAKNQGIRAALEKELGVPLRVPPEPQITGALGVALAAANKPFDER